jgi:GNAT superfamily N-acetyltransferase
LTSSVEPTLVRRAEPADARRVAEVHTRTWQTAYRHVFPPEVLDSLDVEERVRGWLERIEADMAVWVAETGDGIAGFLAAGPSRTEDGLGELYAIYVLPEAWGSGAGAALMSAFKDWLADEGYTTAMLWVLADNPRARRFYEREGWRVDGERVDTIRGIDVPEALYRLEPVSG